MQVENSEDLVLKKIYLTDTNVLCIFPEKGQRIRMDRLKIDYDFDFFTSGPEETAFEFLINLNIKCNEEEKPGYFFETGVVGEFLLKNTDTLDDAVQKQYILYTALPMMINSARIYIQQITSMHAFGPFLLPVMNLTDLLEKMNDSL